MDWIKTIAPMIGTALAGPFGGVAAMLVSQKLGLSDSTVKAVTSALTAGQLTGEQMQSMKQAEIDFQKFMTLNDLTREQLIADNTKDARAMQVTTRSNTPAVLTYLITVGFFGILGVMMTDLYRASEPLLVMLGSLGTAWVACVNFWFGSTSGSKDKTELLARAQPVK